MHLLQSISEINNYQQKYASELTLPAHILVETNDYILINPLAT